MATKGGNRDFRYRIDLDPVLKFAEQLGTLTEQELSRVTVESLNSVTEGLYDIGRGRMIKNINLTDAYLQTKMSLDKATPGNPTASITAVASDTVLGRFDAKPVTVATKTPASKLKGNPALGIPAGRKQAGVTVQVLRGQTNSDFVPRGFLLPLRAGKVDGGNGLGVFARRRSGEKKHRYGPSPYQLFRAQIPDLSNEAPEAFELDVQDRLEELVRKTFA